MAFSPASWAEDAQGTAVAATTQHPSDHEFLEQLERKDAASTAAPAPAAAAAPAPVATEQIPSAVAQGAESSKPADTTKAAEPEGPVIHASKDKPKPIVHTQPAPQPRKKTIRLAGSESDLVTEAPPEPTAPREQIPQRQSKADIRRADRTDARGPMVVEQTTTVTRTVNKGPDGRTYVVERKTTSNPSYYRQDSRTANNLLTPFYQQGEDR